MVFLSASAAFAEDSVAGLAEVDSINLETNVINNTVIQTDMGEPSMTVAGSSDNQNNSVEPSKTLKDKIVLNESFDINYMAINDAISNLSDGGIIVLDVDNLYNVYLGEKYNHIFVTKNMTIMSAQGRYAGISGKIAGITSTVTPHIFVLSPGVHLTLIDLYIKQIGGPDDGSIVYNDVGATVDFINVHFMNSFEENSLPIVNKNGTINIINCTGSEIVNNVGDLIQNEGILTIVNSTFSSLYSNGVAIRNSGNLTISNSVFASIEGNDAGVIYNTGIVTITNNSRFVNNKGLMNAGVIYNEGTLDIIDGIFTRNQALNGDGGVIYNTGIVTISGSTFYSSNASSRGGAIYSNNDCTILDSVFSNCDAAKGGIIYSEFEKSELNIEHVTFRNNTAREDALIYITDTQFNIKSSEFKDNTKISSSIIKNNGLGTIVDSIFDNNGNNISTKHIIENYLYINIVNTTFDSNYAKFGASVYNKIGNVLISKSNFYNNWAEYGGAIYNVMRGTVTITNSNFASNVALQSGGAIYGDGGNFRITSVVFDSNSARAASAIYLANDNAYDDSVFATVYNSVFNENRAYDYKIIHNDVVLTLRGCAFTGESKVSYIYNDNELYLENNKMNPREDAVNIFNNGIITSPIYLIILDNTTVKGELNQPIPITAILVDDMNNTIAGNLVGFKSNGEIYRASYDENGIYTNDDVCVFNHRGYYVLDANLRDATSPMVKTAGISIPFEDSPLIVDYHDVTYGNTSTIIITSPTIREGSIDVTIDGSTTQHNLINGKVILELGVLNVGQYSISVSYAGDDTYAANSTSFVLTVSKIVIDNENFKVVMGDNDLLIVNVNLPADITGRVAVYVDGILQNLELVDGKGIVSVDLPDGFHNVRLYYEGDNNYASYFEAISVLVGSKESTDMVIKTRDVAYGELVTIDVLLNNYATGKVNLTVDNVSHMLVISKGKASTTLNLSMGVHNISASYEGDSRFEEMTLHTRVSVLKALINETNVNIGSNALNIKVDIDLPEDITGNVVVVVNGTSYDVTLNNGKGSTVISESNPDKYNVTVMFAGDDHYEAINITKIIVLKLNSTVRMVLRTDEVEYGGEIWAKVVLPSDATGNVTFVLEDVNYTIPAEFVDEFRMLHKFTIGSHEIYVYYNGDGKYSPSSNKTSITVVRGHIDYENPAVLNVTNGDRNVTVSVDLPEGANGAVTVEVDGYSYYLPSVAGVGSLTLDLPVGMHKLNITYTAITNYYSFSKIVYVNIEDLRKDSRINVTIDDVKYGEDVVVKVQVPNEISGDEILVIKIGERVFYVPVSQAKYNYYLSTILPVGNNYSASVHYSGDAIFKDITEETAFKVIKNTISGNAIEIASVNRGIHVSLTFPGSINDNVTINVDGDEYIVELQRGMGNLELPEMVGNHYVIVNYDGNDHYESITETAILNITDLRKDVNLSINVNDAIYGVPIIFNISVDYEATGTITITGGSKNYTGEVINGTCIINVGRVHVGQYNNISIIYSGDYYYKNQTKTSHFTVGKATIDPESTVFVNTSDREIRVDFLAPANTTGMVVIKIDDVEYVFNLTDFPGGAILAIPSEGGNHTVDVLYKDDPNFNGFNKTVNVTVSDLRKTTPMDIVIRDVKYGNPIIVNIKVPNDANGPVTVVINDQEFTGEVIDGVASVTAGTYQVGEYSVKITFAGDSNYKPVTLENVKAIVEKTSVDPEPLVTIVGGDRDILVGVDVPTDMVGMLTVTVGDVIRQFDLASQVGGVILMTAIDEGNYTVLINYGGDFNYEPFDYAHSATVYDLRNDTPIYVSVDDAQYGQTIDINIELGSKNINDNIRVLVNNNYYMVPVTSGVGKLTINKLAVGNYSVAAYFFGDNNNKDNSTSTTFKVTKYVTSYKDLVFDVIGNNIIIDINLPNDAFGNVTVDVDGTQYSFVVIKGHGNISIPSANGQHNVAVNYSGDENYLPFEFSDVVAIGEKIDSDLIIDVNETQYGEPVVIDITLNNFASGTVDIKIDGKEYNCPVSGGKAQLSVDGLLVGNYDIVANYLGNGRFNAVSNTSTVRVIKSNVNPESAVVVDVSELNITIAVDLPVDAVGKITVDVNGTEYNIPLTNGSGKLTITMDKAGDYDVAVKYADGLHYDDFVVNREVILRITPKLNIIIEGNRIIHDAVTNIKVDLPIDATGNVILKIADTELNVSAEEARNGVDVVLSVNVGLVDVIASYSGDDKYNAATVTVPFVVEKGNIDGDAAVNVTGGDRVVTIKVGLPFGVTGNVSAFVDSIEYDIPLVEGEGEITVPINPNTKNVIVNYDGDSNHNSFIVNKFVNISDSRKEPSMNVTMSDAVHDAPLSIEVQLPTNATGDVTVIVDGEETHIGELSDGKVVIRTDEIKNAGNHSISIIYSGDDTYRQVSKVINITAAKAVMDPEEFVDVTNTNDSATIEVSLPSDVTGNVDIVVDGVKHTIYVTEGSGKVAITVPLKAGSHEVSVNYSGDDNYEAFAITKTVNTSDVRPAPAINVSVANATSDKPVVVDINLPSDAQGELTVSLEDKKITVPIIDGKAQATFENISEGTHTIKVEYSGDDNYKATSIFEEIKVSKPLLDVDNIKIETVLKEDMTSDIVIKLAEKVDGKINVTINGITYESQLVDGVASVTVPATVGSYDAVVDIDATGYEPVQVNKTVKVSNFTLTADDLEMYFQDGSQIVVKLTNGDKPVANEAIYFDINGETYKRTTDANGTARFKVNLGTGEYNVAISYNGKDNVTIYRVVKVKTTILAKDLVKVFRNASQFDVTAIDKQGNLLDGTKLQFNINGVIYYRTLKNGSAQFAINLAAGNYILTVLNQATGEMASFNIVVLSSLEGNDTLLYYRNGSSYCARALDADGTPLAGVKLSFNINGELYSRTTDDNGIAKLKINLPAGTYIITAIHSVTGEMHSNYVVVLPTITGNDVTKKQGTPDFYAVRLLDGMGNAYAKQVVTFNLNGVLYYRTTDVNGIAKLNINLMPGEYVVTAVYEEGSALTSNKIIVKA